ncbi:MAG: GTPase HflX [Calditrichaceae bacterium]|nr:GTPase HflX [Calditrichaceae bacterium]MBN2708446.1 GTPase HflX [Calditrichaceae bacterium]RQV93060.1 MAG: GTPase HflX [Calditrichota bacterium]
MIDKSENTIIFTEAERCILVGIAGREQSRWETEDHLDELESLAETSGAEIVERFIQDRPAPDPAFFVGRGKLEEIAQFIEWNNIALVIFDDDLSPAQIKNIENILNTKVIDRSALILDIFADHARTNEAKVQVELAQLNYLLPRLTRQWQHLSRQIGGIGTKGPGETQLETDRRLVRTRIAHLKTRLEKISRQSLTQRQQRSEMFRAALIGYTNAGKSTLMNLLSGAEVLVENKLFATLDTTVRKINLDKNTEILLSDTVGFIRKLPHHLVASFRTTLAEAAEADLLIQVSDLSHPHFEDHLLIVNQILSDLKFSHKKRLLVFNKLDKVKNSGLLERIKSDYPEAVFISASRQIGIPALKKHILSFMEELYEVDQIKLNYLHGTAEHLFYPIAEILERRSDDSYLYLKIKYAKENKNRIMQIAERYK